LHLKQAEIYNLIRYAFRFNFFSFLVGLTFCKKLIMIFGVDFSGLLYRRIARYRIDINIFLFNRLAHIYCYLTGTRVEKGTIFNGFPKIYREPYSKIQIGTNCRLNSSKNSVEMQLNKRCVFVTESEGAEIIIGNNCGVSGASIVAYKSVKVGNNVLIGAYCTIIDNDFHNPNPAKRNASYYGAKPVTIEDNVFLGMNCTVLKGVTIGKNSVIAANSLVIHDIQPNSFAMGNPCKVIMRRNWGEANA
jgi:acetyltransferase-like isoleucine patch superfamily enzyme